MSLLENAHYIVVKIVSLC